MGIPMGIPMGMGMGWVWGLKFNPNGSSAKVTLTVYDGNATFYYMKDIPANFSQICSKVFDTIGKTDVVHLFVS